MKKGMKRGLKSFSFIRPIHFVSHFNKSTDQIQLGQMCEKKTQAENEIETIHPIL